MQRGAVFLRCLSVISTLRFVSAVPPLYFCLCLLFLRYFCFVFTLLRFCTASALPLLCLGFVSVLYLHDLLLLALPLLYPMQHETHSHAVWEPY